MVMTKVVPALTEVVWQDSATDVAGAEDDDFSYTPLVMVSSQHTQGRWILLKVNRIIT
ncbi:unnamed protein product [Brassica oleracea var. botrytis]